MLETKTNKQKKATWKGQRLPKKFKTITNIFQELKKKNEADNI